MDLNNLLTLDRSPGSQSPSSPVDKEKENTNHGENSIKSILNNNTNEVNNTNRPIQKKGRYKTIPQKSLSRNQFEKLFNITPNNPSLKMGDKIPKNNTNEVSNTNQNLPTQKNIRYKQYPKKDLNVPTIMPNSTPKMINTSPPKKFREILNPTNHNEDAPNEYTNESNFWNHEIKLNFPIIIEQSQKTFIQNIDIEDESSETEKLNSSFPITEFLAEEILNGFHYDQSQNFPAEFLVMKIYILLNEFIEKNPSKSGIYKTHQKFLMEILFLVFKIKFDIQRNKDATNYIKMIHEKWPNFFILANVSLKSCPKEERIDNYRHERNIDVYKECLAMLNRAFSKENEIAPWLYTDLHCLVQQEGEYDFDSNFSHIETAILFVNGSLDHYLKAIHTLHSNTSELDEQFIDWLENFIIEIECYKDKLIGKLQICLKNSRQEVKNFIEESSGIFHGNFNLQKYVNLFSTVREFNSLYATITSPELPLYKNFDEFKNLEALKDDEKLKISEMTYLRIYSFGGFLRIAAQPLLKMSKVYFDQLNTRLHKIRLFNSK